MTGRSDRFSNFVFFFFFVQDLVDGYFPQELKHQYPEGVKISLVNKVDQTYEQSVKATQQNQRPPPKPTRQNLPSNIRQLGSLQEKDDGDAAEPSTETFLDRVPKTVIQNGKIIQVSTQKQTDRETGQGNSFNTHGSSYEQLLCVFCSCSCSCSGLPFQ